MFFKFQPNWPEMKKEDGMRLPFVLCQIQKPRRLNISHELILNVLADNACVIDCTVLGQNDL